MHICMMDLLHIIPCLTHGSEASGVLRPRFTSGHVRLVSGGGAQSRARDVCEVRIRLWIRTERISHAEALISMSEAVVNSSPLLFRCVFVGDSSIFVTNIFSLILGIIVAVLAFPDGENL